MSTARTTPIDNISSILLGLRRIYPDLMESPAKILPYLHDPIPSDDYHYLDALATLCTFAGTATCDSVAAAVGYGEESNRLYLATSSSSSSTNVRSFVPAWIDLMQNLSRQSSYGGPPSAQSEPEKDEVLKPWDRDHTVPEQTFIVEIYRACHAKLLDVVNCQAGLAQRLLDVVTDMDDAELRFWKILGSPLVEEIQFLISVVETRGSKDCLSDKDLLRLHRAAVTVAWLKVPIAAFAPFYGAVYRLSDAVDTLIKFASSAQYKAKVDRPWTVVWVDVPDCSPAFLATTNAQELAAIVTDEKPLRDELVSVFNTWGPFEPPAPSDHDPRDVRMHMVDGSPDHFTGDSVVHGAAALVSYFCRSPRDVSRAVEPYLGCSHPICYPCLMLVDACNWGGEMDPFVEVGRRCVEFGRLDVAWAYPREMGSEIYWMLLDRVAADFEHLCTQQKSSMPWSSLYVPEASEEP